MKYLSIKQQLFVGFGVLAATVLAVSLLSMRALGMANADYWQYVHVSAVQESLAIEVRAAANRRALAEHNAVLAPTAGARQQAQAQFRQADDDVNGALAKLQKSVDEAADTDERERALLTAVTKAEADCAPASRAVMELAMAEQTQAATDKLLAVGASTIDTLRKAIAEYVNYSREQAHHNVEEAQARYAAQRTLLIGSCALALAVALAIGWFIASRLVRALGAEPAELSRVARQVAEGDLSPVSGGAAAPSRSVLASMSEMQQKLLALIGQVRSTSDGIATASAQIATGNADLSSRTEQQASALQQTAASMQQMTETVRQNADSAQQASELASAAAQVADRGGEVVGKVVATMEDISAASRRIADIIGVIDGIAFQTNILALNAAVEAARAGEQGRGFAVVAGEVRLLAQRSADAAKEIKALIGASVDKVEAGGRLVHEAGTTMDEIVQQVQRVTALIAEISASTQAQSSGITQVNQAVSSLDTGTQQNAALVEQSAAAAESLRQQAQGLTQMISVFRVSEAQARQAIGTAQASARYTATSVPRNE